MLIIFKSPASGDVIMFEKNGKEMLSVLGKDPADAKGIVTVEQLPGAIAAVRAVDCAAYALLSDGQHIVSFDEVVRTMWETGCDMKASYRETAAGGLAKIHLLRMHGAKSVPGMGS